MTTEPPVWSSPLTPLHFLRRSAAVFADRPAIIYGDRRTTYAQFNQRVNRLASALQAVGVQPGDRVAVLCPNIPQMLEAHYGVPLAGAILVPLNIRLTAAEVGAILEHAGATVLVVDTEFARLVEPIRSQLRSLTHVVLVHDTGAQTALAGEDYEAFLGRGDPADRPLPLQDESDLISINYTSGTTGQPKGAMLHHRGAYLNALGEALETRLWSDSVFLWTLPMFHCNGWCFTWATVAVGAANVCLRKVEPPLVWDLVHREDVTHLNAAPSVLILLLNDPAAQNLRLARKLTVATGGAPPSPTLIGQLEAIGAEVIHLYGLTEVYGPHSVCEWRREWDDLPLAERARLKARQGVTYITAGPLRVVDDELRDVPADGVTLGEVVMGGNTVMRGYYQNEAATAEAFRGGWFHSGDLAVVDEQGYIELRDRKKDIIISGGENISTIEVEQAIAQHPAVLEVAVIAVPDEQWGEVPKAFVTLKAGQSLSAGELVEFCRGRLARFKCPKAVEFGPLPKTATGKVQKFVLRNREWATLDKRVH